MSPIEIEEAVEALVELPFDMEEFAFQFLAAFDTSDAAIRRLKSGAQNQSDICGVLNRNNIHIATCDIGAIDDTFAALLESPKTVAAKAKFVLATDGESIQAQNMKSGETLSCAYADLPDYFGFFLQLAGISTVKEIEESSFDIRATGRLNKLYLQLLEDNPDWSSNERRPDMNHFMARLIFCFFAEDTDIFVGEGLFTKTIQKMSAADASDTHLIISELFRAMDTKIADREAQNIPRYANQFPYVNGQLFSGDVAVPIFTKIARSYLFHIGNLDWKKINPDIFGSMIQAITEDDQRSTLGIHYTSVPNILKVLNPLFLDDLSEKLEEAGDNGRKLLNLRNRISKIRVFDPACGSGNFLVIAYKSLREIEYEINKRRGESEVRSSISLKNFRGIELRDFPAEIARLALIIAEYQSNIIYLGQQEALAEFLPLDSKNWITCVNALRVDWLDVCPPAGKSVRITGDDLFNTPLDQSEIDFENEGGETYICGNPPYLGSREQAREHKDDLKNIFGSITSSYKALDYVAGWFLKAGDYTLATDGAAAFVTTNSISQGQQVPLLWSLLFSRGIEIIFAQTSFKWRNLASYNAGVTVIIVGFSAKKPRKKLIFSETASGELISTAVNNINGYLVGAENTTLEARKKPLSNLTEIQKGNYPVDGGHLLLTSEEAQSISLPYELKKQVVRRFAGSSEIIRGKLRFCLWIKDSQAEQVSQFPSIAKRLAGVKHMRESSKKEATKKAALTPHRFDEVRQTGNEKTIIGLPVHSSENREWLPFDLLPRQTIVYGSAFAVFDAPFWNIAILASRIHLVWIATVCGKLKTDFRYSNTLGWNTFPVPTLTEQNKTDLTRCVENILLAREAHFPATIADLYDSKKMPEDLRLAQDANDETLERIYIGRRFRNDTERLEKLFELYTKMTTQGKAA